MEGVRDDIYLVWFGRLLCRGVGVAGGRDDIYLVWFGIPLCRGVGVSGVRDDLYLVGLVDCCVVEWEWQG